LYHRNFTLVGLGLDFQSLNIYGFKYGISIAGATVNGSIYLLDSYFENSEDITAMPATSSDLLKTNYLNIDNLRLAGVPATVT
jgi:hypothetical protein